MKISIHFLLSAIFCLLTFYPHTAFSQRDKTQILDNTNVEDLQNLAHTWGEETRRAKEIAIQKARQNGWIQRKEYPDGTVIELMRLDEAGDPVYFTTTNVNAARTIRTDKVHSGGGAGLDLNGSGMLLGEWDGGIVLPTHEQFNGRVVQIDHPSVISDHATITCGTLIGDGTGIGKNAAGAKGMAPQATIHAYDSDLDRAEMVAEAYDGLLVSNHSYGFLSGWKFDGPAGQFNTWTWYGGSAQYKSLGQDPCFGKYVVEARDMDIIAKNAPYYLIVRSAGNDRNNNPSTLNTMVKDLGGDYELYDPTLHPAGDGIVDGGYDCLIGGGANAKNVLTVAAVDDVLTYSGPGSVPMTNFSGWGPTDDGRIKPDISANGVTLWTSIGTSDTSYIFASGTSLSTPSVAGSAILLQEHYEKTHGSGRFMRAATLKALIIHTADEAGLDPGPDYRFGWGLMNTESAARVISDDADYANASVNIITEATLIEGSYSVNVISNGMQPLVATLAWTDPAASSSPVSDVDDPTIKLVNDLDLSLSMGITTFMPYVLDPANPANAATTGNNDRDNVEKIYLGTPEAGSYALTVSHEGALTGSQAFSLIVTGSNAIPVSCLPSYQHDCYSGDYIDAVIFNTIDNSGTGCADPGNNNYSDYTALSTEVNQSASYSIVLEPGTFYFQYFVVLMDFNQDAHFTPNEFFDVGFAMPGGTVSKPIRIPDDAVIGTTLMRVICSSDTIKFPSICGNMSNGEVEDYSLEIVDPDCPNNLSTLFNRDNQQDGNMFSISNSGNQVLTINAFDVNVGAGSGILEVYYTTHASTHIGHETNPLDWTLLGSAQVTFKGVDIPTRVDIGGLVLAPGESKGIYVTSGSAGSPTMQYTNGIGSLHNDGNLSIDLTNSTGNAYPFGQVFTPRQWNGTICYSLHQCQSTLFNSNSSQDGSMFTISNSGAKALSIDEFEVNVGSTSEGTIEVYYTTYATTHLGHETVASDWTLLGSTTITFQGNDNPTSVPIGGLVLMPGESKGIYITTGSMGAPYMLYTGGIGTIYSDGNLSIDLTNSTGNVYPFGNFYTPRQWNGTICYEFVDKVCKENLTISTNPILSGTYEASRTITSSSVVEASTSVIFNAGENILLNPAFEVKGEFLAISGDGCTEDPPVSQINPYPEVSHKISKADLLSVPEFHVVAIQQDIQPALILINLSLPFSEVVNLYFADSSQNEIARLIDNQYLEKGTYSKNWDLAGSQLKGSYQLVVKAGSNKYVQNINFD